VSARTDPDRPGLARNAIVADGDVVISRRQINAGIVP
jgi:hypothetical protein